MNHYFHKIMLLVCCVLASTIAPLAASATFRMEDEPKVSTNLPSKHERVFLMLKQKNPTTMELLSKDAFVQGYTAFLKLKKQQFIDSNQNILTICDFTLSSNVKRMWIIDLKQQKVLFNNLVSHGKNTGEEFATTFSNKVSSYQSSLGVYLTSHTYEGSNGYSLRLTGMDKGLNDNAEERAIVLHGAAYCSEQFIEENGRLGRSFGCPSVPLALHEDIINTIKDKSVFYIYHATHEELKKSQWIAQEPVITSKSQQ